MKCVSNCEFVPNVPVSERFGLSLVRKESTWLSSDTIDKVSYREDVVK